MLTINKTITNDALISVADATTQCRVDSSDPEIVAIQAELTETIKDAVDVASRDINADIAYTDVVYTDDEFAAQYIIIKEGILASITSITVATVAVSSYTYEVHHGYFIVKLDSSYSGTLVVTFKTGFVNAAAVPRGLRRALLVKIHDMYDPERTSYLPNVLAKQKTYEYLLKSFTRNYY